MVMILRTESYEAEENYESNDDDNSPDSLVSRGNHSDSGSEYETDDDEGFDSPRIQLLIFQGIILTETLNTMCKIRGYYGAGDTITVIEFLKVFDVQSGFYADLSDNRKHILLLNSYLCYVRNLDGVYLLQRLLPLVDITKDKQLCTRAILARGQRTELFLDLEECFEGFHSLIRTTSFNKNGPYHKLINGDVLHLYSILKEKKEHHCGSTHSHELTRSGVLDGIIRLATSLLFCKKCSTKLLTITSNKAMKYLNDACLYYIYQLCIRSDEDLELNFDYNKKFLNVLNISETRHYPKIGNISNQRNKNTNLFTF